MKIGRGENQKASLMQASESITTGGQAPMRGERHLYSYPPKSDKTLVCR